MGYKIFTVLAVALFSGSAIGQIIDSKVTLAEALQGTDAPAEIVREVAIVDVEYYSIDSLLHRGQVVINRALVSDVVEIFAYIKAIRYPVQMVVPIKFDMANGMTTMANLNNSYGFHYRKAVSSKTILSNHSMGLAIDFNPFNNPYLSSSGDVKPVGAVYDLAGSQALTASHPLVVKMKQMGWIWGGDWINSKDYMHFEKQIK